MNEYVEFCIQKRRAFLKYLRDIVRNYDLAEDLYQDMLENLLRYPPVTPEKTHPAYLAIYTFNCASNRARRYLERDRRGIEIDVNDEGFDGVDLSNAQLTDGQRNYCADPADLLVKERVIANTQRQLDKVGNPVHRQLLEELMSGSNFSDAASVTGITENNARVVCHRLAKRGLNGKDTSRGPGS